VTFNEPNYLIPLAYREGKFPPCRCSGKFGDCSGGDSEKEPFVVAHNMILSHAAAVDIYRNKYQVISLEHRNISNFLYCSIINCSIIDGISRMSKGGKLE